MRMRLSLSALALALFAVACTEDAPKPETKDSKPAASTAAAAPSASAVAPAPASASAAAPSASAAAAPEPASVASAAPSASAKASAAAKVPGSSSSQTTKAPTEKVPATSASTEKVPATSASSTTSVPAPAPAPGSADAVAVDLDNVFLKMKTFSAKFKQEHTQKVTGTVKKSTGLFFFERPNKISFRYDAPSKNRIVSDGQQLKVYIGEDSQMFVQPVDKTEYPGALAFLMGKGLAPSFAFTFNEKTKFEGGPVLLGKPKQPTPHYDSVFFYVDKALLEKKDPGVIRRVMLVDVQGNRNRFDFEDVKQPEKIDPAEFVFTPPPGTNITQN